VNPRLALVSLAGAALVSLAGCSDDDDGARQAAEDYALEVETISDDANRASDRALVTLNKVTDGSIDPGRAIGILETESRRIDRKSTRLADLAPPGPAAQAADDLEFQLDTLALELRSAATDVRVAERGDSDLAATGRSNARVVLVSSSSASALSRSLRALALEATD
jgi:hypothetical protein